MFIIVGIYYCGFSANKITKTANLTSRNEFMTLYDKTKSEIFVSFSILVRAPGTVGSFAAAIACQKNAISFKSEDNFFDQFQFF